MNATKDNLEMNGVIIKHHFAAGTYIKETFIPAGIELTQHTHSYDHSSVLVSGVAIVEVNGVSNRYDTPQILTIEAGKKHKVIAVTDVTWLCIHATDDKNPETVDISLMSKVVKE